MKLTEKLRLEANSIWERIILHPFVVELYTGVLPLEKFKYYLIQDYNYLVTMYKCFSLIAAKADYEIAQTALKLAYLDALIEMKNYENLINRIGLDINIVVETEPSPTNTAYMSFLLATCALRNPIESLITLLPCFWSYLEIAEKHFDKLRHNRNELYIQWASAYLSKDYRDVVNELRNIVDKYSNRVGYNTVKQLFITASRFEYMFWDMSYRGEKWPV